MTEIFRPGNRVRVGSTEGTVIPTPDTVRVRFDNGHEADFLRTDVVKVYPQPGREWAVKHHTCSLWPQGENAARFTQQQIPGSVLVHWDGQQWAPDGDLP